VTLSAGLPIASPSQPEAGQTFFYSLDVFVRVGTARRTPIERGAKPLCIATVGGRRIQPVTQVVRPGQGVLCKWEIPASAAGQTMLGTVIVRYKGATLRHPFTFRVR
jgi:hypothetical protein